MSSYSDALRTAFDNGEYGQDYASENSFSGIVKLYYNTLFSGTPKAMCRFFPDVEDGLVSRVLFDQDDGMFLCRNEDVTIEIVADYGHNVE